MAIRVKLPNGKYGNFPDGMSHSEIESVLQKQFPKEESKSMQGLKNIGKDWGRFGQNVGIGLAEMGRGLLNSPHNIANLFGQGEHVSPLAPEDFDYAKALGAEGEPSLSDKLVRGLAQYAPAMALPGANLGKAGSLIGSLPKAGKFTQGALEQAIPQAAFSATQNENPLQGAAEGAEGSFGGSLLTKGLEKGFNALKPARLLKTPLNKKELVREYQKAKGTNADLGNLIENPRLQRRYENKLPKVTNEVYKRMQDTAQQITEKGSGILNKLLGKNSAENVPEQLTKSLTGQYIKNQKFKKELYDETDSIAEHHEFKPNLNNFASKAKEYISAIEDTTLLKHEPEAKKIINKLIGYSEPMEKITTKGSIVDKYGKPLNENTKEKYPSLKEANILKGLLSNYANIYSQSSSGADRNIARIFRGLSKSLKNDINESIEKSGIESLKNSYNNAEQNYAKNFSPFLEKDVYKFVSGNADPETLITKFLTTSRTSDLANKLSKLSERLGTKQSSEGMENRDLLAYGFLSRAVDKEGNINPFKLSNLVNSLGKNQFKTLFPDKALRKELLDYKTLTKKNQEALNVMYNPKTGQRNADIHPHALSQFLGALGGAVAGGPMTALISAIAAPVIRSKAASYEVKKLTDPDFRRKIIKALVNNKETKISNEKGSKLGALLSDIRGNDKEHKPLELELRKAIPKK